MLSVIDPYILLGIGVVLIAFEAIITSFILIWFGIGFVLTAFISYLYPFEDGIWQLAIASFISILLLLLLRKRTFKKFLSSNEKITDNFLNVKGIGQIKNEKVFYKGTYWEIDGQVDESIFNEGEKVVVTKTFKNFATIEKKN
ncbi:MAG: nodulation efficiency protein D [Arcobacter sp.]|nr:nodulation efficiency protein D [Arcobacter sp.]|tara:strand:- start:440 stop:868 length:429 start_codon:yes stop_codon:yes gene_type:complete